MNDHPLTFTMGWSECLPILLMVRDNAELPERRTWADAELHRMAVIADKAGAYATKLETAEPTEALNLTRETRATMLAALTHYLRSGQGEPEHRTGESTRIAERYGAVAPADNAFIEELIGSVAMVRI